jgi:hypothetical protein
MSIQVDCPECGNPHRVKDEIAGKKFACKQCGAAVRVPQPVSASQDIDVLDPKPTKPASAKRDPDDFDWSEPLGDTVETAEAESVEDMPALPPVSRKKKQKPARPVAGGHDDHDDDDEDGALYRSSSSTWMIAGMPVPIVISLGCNAVLWFWTAFQIYQYLSGARPWSALGQIIRIAWLTWLMYDLSNGAMRARYLSILMSISGLTWAAVAWTVFIPLMALAPLVKEQPWLRTLFYIAVIVQASVWTTNIIALCMPSAAEHCSDWDGG